VSIHDNNLGIRVESDEMSIEYSAPTKIQNVRIEKGRSGKELIQWNIPENNGGSSQIAEYRVKCCAIQGMTVSECILYSGIKTECPWSMFSNEPGNVSSLLVSLDPTGDLELQISVVAINFDGLVGEISDCVVIHPGASPRWDASHSGARLNIDTQGKTVSKGNEEDDTTNAQCTAFGATNLNTGDPVHEWSLSISTANDYNRQIIGIAQLHDNSDDDPHRFIIAGWGTGREFKSGGSVAMSGTANEVLPFKRGPHTQVVILRYDRAQKTLSMANANSIDKQIAITGVEISGDVRPVVLIESENNTVTIGSA